MWSYEKRLQYPVRITNPNPKIAQVILSQYGGPDGELGASLRYLSQRYTKGDPITDLSEDLGAEQKARTTYDNILRLVDDPDVRDPIAFLREREIVHYQRFGEGLRMITEELDAKNFYAFNPAFDKQAR